MRVSIFMVLLVLSGCDGSAAGSFFDGGKDGFAEDSKPDGVSGDVRGDAGSSDVRGDVGGSDAGGSKDGGPMDGRASEMAADSGTDLGGKEALGSKGLGDECSADSECSVGKCVFGQPGAMTRNVTKKVCCDKDCSSEAGCLVCTVGGDKKTTWCGLVTCLPIPTYQCSVHCPYACCKA